MTPKIIRGMLFLLTVSFGFAAMSILNTEPANANLSVKEVYLPRQTGNINLLLDLQNKSLQVDGNIPEDIVITVNHKENEIEEVTPQVINNIKYIYKTDTVMKHKTLVMTPLRSGWNYKNVRINAPMATKPKL